MVNGSVTLAIRCVGIDLGLRGSHKAVALDEGGNVCGRLSFNTCPEGFKALLSFCFQGGSLPTVVMEPTGLAWFPLAVFLKARCPKVTLVRAKQQKVAALRRVISGNAKSDRIDALSLAKLVFVDAENLQPMAMPNPGIQRLDRKTRRRDKLAASIGSRKTRVANLMLGLFPGLWECFTDPWNPRARWIYRHRLNPFRLTKLSPSQLMRSFKKITPHVSNEVIQRDIVALRQAAKDVVSIYQPAMDAHLISQELIETWVEEIDQEMALIETEESQISQLDRQIQDLYHKLHPQDNLRTIPGVGRVIAPLLLSAIGDAMRFHSVKAFCQWAGVVPGSHQSSTTQLIGLRITKAGPARIRRALYQAGECARRWDPQLGAIYFRQMACYGKTHKQAMGAVMSHLAARIYTVLKQDRAYRVLDVEGKPVSMTEGKRIISEHYTVPQYIRRMRRNHHPVGASFGGGRRRTTANGAASAPQRSAIMYPPPNHKTTRKLSNSKSEAIVT